jgi:transcriptional regulator with XRE-family HTH domain/tetratricopeptide (TPR) repeat protein
MADRCAPGVAGTLGWFYRELSSPGMIGDQMSESLPVSFGSLLRSLRTAAGLTQEELAEAARVSYRSISDLERGVSRSPHRDTARLLADALGLSGDDRARFEAAARGRPPVTGTVVPRPQPGGITAAPRSLPRDIASFTGREPEIEISALLLPSAAPPAGPDTSRPVVIGNIPQRPAASQPRVGLLERATGQDAGTPGVVALTGTRGAGKTQLAAAVARARIAAGWRLVAWVDAEDRRMILAGLHQVACVLGLADPATDAQDSAAAVRHHLEATGERCLLVLDNVVDPDAVMPFLPAAGRSQTVITGARRTLGNLARAVTVNTFTAEEAITYLTERTGLADANGARAVAEELGYLPLALAQAAAVIDSQRLNYGTYWRRLRAMTVADYLPAVPGDPYPHGAAQAILLSAADITGGPGHCRALLDLVAMLSPTGVSRQYLQRAGRLGLLHSSLKPGKRGPAIPPTAVDALLGCLADASLINISVGDGVVTAHRLIMRVLREQLAHDHHLIPVATAAAALLTDLLIPSKEAWTQPRAADELVKQITALNDHLPADTWTTVPDRHLAEAVLALRARALWYLNDAMTLPSHNMAFANALVTDSARILGSDHRDTLTARNHLGWAYETADDLQEATRRYEQTAADRAQVLGPDHLDTLASRHNLAWAYFSTGRLAEAITLGEKILTDRGRMLGPDHPIAIVTCSLLSNAYARAGRYEDAVSLGEQYVSKSQQILGPDHPDALAARGTLAFVYAVAGRYEEAIAMNEDQLSDRQRVLGSGHPDTFISRHNLARTYEMAGQREEAIRRYQQTLADCTRMLGPHHPVTRAVRKSLATDYSRTSSHDPYLRRRNRPS